METLGEKLKRLRRERRKTQAEIASKCGVTQGTYSLYEANKAKPGAMVLLKIADVLGVQIAALDEELSALPCFDAAPTHDTDAELQEILAAWHSLSSEQRNALVAVVRTWRNKVQ